MTSKRSRSVDLKTVLWPKWEGMGESIKKKRLSEQMNRIFSFLKKKTKTKKRITKNKKYLL